MRSIVIKNLVVGWLVLGAIFCGCDRVQDKGDAGLGPQSDAGMGPQGDAGMGPQGDAGLEAPVDAGTGSADEIEPRCSKQNPLQVIVLEPADTSTFHLSHDKLIVRVRHDQYSEDYSSPVSIYSIDRYGKNPILLSSNLENVIVLSNGMVLGYYWEIYSYLGASYELDPDGVNPPILFDNDIVPHMMHETPYGLVVPSCSSNSEIDRSSWVSFYPYTETGIDSPKKSMHITDTYSMKLTADKCHVFIYEKGGEFGSRNLIWMDLSTFQETVVDENTLLFEVAPVSNTTVWLNSSGQLVALQPSSGNKHILGEDYLEDFYLERYGVYDSLKFTLDGQYVILPSGFLVEVATGRVIELPHFVSFGPEIDWDDGSKSCFVLLEDGSIMLGEGTDPALVKWKRFVPDTGESYDILDHFQVFTEFSIHEGSLYAMEPFEIFGPRTGDGALFKFSLLGGEATKIANKIRSDFKWLDQKHVITITDLDEFRTLVHGDSSYVLTQKGTLRLIDVTRNSSCVLHENVRIREFELFLEQGFLAYAVSTPENPSQSGIYIENNITRIFSSDFK